MMLQHVRRTLAFSVWIYFHIVNGTSEYELGTNNRQYLWRSCDLVEFTCDNGNCIPWLSKCDFIDDCGDGSDEKDDTCNRCTESQYKCYFDDNCINKSKTCDGRKDCSDWSDETPTLCGGDCSYGTDMFQCDNNICIYKNLTCNGRNNCFDWSDEVGCPCDQYDKFQCLNKKCINYNLLCDGSNDCGDFSDEIHLKCHKKCSYYERSCINGLCVSFRSHCDGKNDCGDYSDESDCEICRWNQFRCERSRSCIPSSWRCNGASDCPHGEDEENCRSANPNNFRCGSGEFVTHDLLCDGFQDCKDSSDEESCNSPINATSGKYGPGLYDCHCEGPCHPGTGACLSACAQGWAGPTCQIRVIPFQMPIQNSGHKIIQSPLSIDGDVRTCSPPAIGTINAYWEANITANTEIRRIRVYNPGDVSYLIGLAQRLTVPSCKVSYPDLVSEGHFDVICDPGTKLRNLLLLAIPKEGQYAIMQICEVKIIVCSNHSFGGQCEKTCNCRGPEGCDDVNGASADGCLSGWQGQHCSELIYKEPLKQRTRGDSKDSKDKGGEKTYLWISLGVVAAVAVITTVLVITCKLRKQSPASSNSRERGAATNQRVSNRYPYDVTNGHHGSQSKNLSPHVMKPAFNPPTANTSVEGASRYVSVSVLNNNTGRYHGQYIKNNRDLATSNNKYNSDRNITHVHRENFM